MKRLIKCFLVLSLICCLLVVNILSVSASYNEALKANGIEIIKTKYVTTIKQDHVIQRTMSESALKSLKNNLNKQGLTEHEKNVEILRSLGHKEETIAGMCVEDIDYMIADAASFQTQVVYMKVNADGSTTVISEEECLAAVELHNIAAGVAESPNDGWGNWTSSDGYMRMTISCVYADPSSMNGEIGWYNFHAWYEWLIMPNYRQTDAMSIAVPTCSWDTLNAPNAYSATMYYRTINGNGDTGTYNRTTPKSMVVAINGVYCTWDLPKDMGLETTLYMQYYMRARARITQFTIPTSVTAYLRYSHTYTEFSVEPSFGWDISSGKVGVSLVPKLGIKANDFYYNVNYTYTP